MICRKFSKFKHIKAQSKFTPYSIAALKSIETVQTGLKVIKMFKIKVT